MICQRCLQFYLRMENKMCLTINRIVRIIILPSTEAPFVYQMGLTCVTTNYGIQRGKVGSLLFLIAYQD